VKRRHFKQWAADGIRMLPGLHFVNAMIGNRCIVILPDRDVELGVLASDEMIEFSGSGTALEPRKVKRPGLTS
jgi:hypothetical protein